MERHKVRNKHDTQLVKQSCMFTKNSDRTKASNKICIDCHPTTLKTETDLTSTDRVSICTTPSHKFTEPNYLDLKAFEANLGIFTFILEWQEPRITRGKYSKPTLVESTISVSSPLSPLGKNQLPVNFTGSVQKLKVDPPTHWYVAEVGVSSGNCVLK